MDWNFGQLTIKQKRMSVAEIRILRPKVNVRSDYGGQNKKLIHCG